MKRNPQFFASQAIAGVKNYLKVYLRASNQVGEGSVSLWGESLLKAIQIALKWHL